MRYSAFFLAVQLHILGTVPLIAGPAGRISLLNPAGGIPICAGKLLKKMLIALRRSQQKCDTVVAAGQDNGEGTAAKADHAVGTETVCQNNLVKPFCRYERLVSCSI